MEDNVAKMVKGLKDSKARVTQGAEWNIRDGLVFYCDRIYVLNDPELRRKIVELHHDSKIAGHPGRWKKLELVSRSYWCRDISASTVALVIYAFKPRKIVACRSENSNPFEFPTIRGKLYP